MQTTLNHRPRTRVPSLGFLALAAASLMGISLASAQSGSSTQPRMGILLWGDNTHGQCQAPAQPFSVKNVQLALGTSHTLAIRSDGSVFAWGDNSFGQLEVPPLQAGQSYIRVAASDHNLALRNDGFLQAWGRDDSGQCKVPVLHGGLYWTAISAGGLHSAGLRSNGTILCWGDNTFGQCDVQKLPPDTLYVAVSAGARHTVALRSDGQLVGWGDNSFGQTNLPPVSSTDPIVAISAGGAHSLALSAGGLLFAWGSDESGQCDVPERPYGHFFTAISAGGRHSLALLDDGTLFAWGADDLGQCRPQKVLATLETVRISAGGQHSGVLYQSTGSDIQPICSGNGSATHCPCSNDVPADQTAGCINSTGQGGALLYSGHSRLDADDLIFHVGGLPRTIAMVLQGVPRPTGSTTGETGVPFGDGLLCLQTKMLRLGVVKTSQGAFTFPAPFGKSLSTLGGLEQPATVYYQVWYRDGQPVCKSMGYNLTNGLRVVWTD